jgi:EAL domain-containing protein (putative c-di-GMP-specific phosphodiesterase class I)
MWVNVSPRQLRDSGFAALVEEVLRATGLPPERLGLEVTEGTFIDDSDAVRATLLRMRSSGVHVAIDDFGTGYSSLAQLEYLPVDVLKIDRQFISEIASGSTRSGIISAILTLARTMGLRVVAEGVETEAQRNVLLQLGCQYGQGYLWSRPLPASQFSGSLWQFRKVAAI